MEMIRQYLLSITAAAFVCALAMMLTEKKGSTAKLVQLISGLFMAITVLRPVLSFSISDLDEFRIQIDREAAEAVASGDAMYRANMESIVKERTTALIIQKAEALGADIQVEVFLDSFVPDGAVLRGAISPYAKKALSEWIEENLRISKEAQEWIN